MRVANTARKRKIAKATALLAAFVALCTAWALVIPALSLSAEQAQPSAGFFMDGETLEAGASPSLNAADVARLGATQLTASQPSTSFEQQIATNDGNTLTVHADAVEGAFSDNVEMRLQEVVDENIVDAAKEAAAAGAAMDADQARAVAVDIAFVDGNGLEVEPAGGSVRVTMTTSAIVQTEDLAVVHVVDESNAELVEAQDVPDAPDAVAFDAPSFSVYAIVYAADSAANLDGKSFVLVNEASKEAVLNGTQNNGTRLTATNVAIQQSDGTSYVIGNNLTQWKFTSAGGNTYYIQDPSDKYINIADQSGVYRVQLTDTPQAITVSFSDAGARLSYDGNALNAWEGKVTEGFYVGPWDGPRARFSLYNVSQVIQYQAEKISVTDLVNKYTQSNPIQDVVIYTRIENAAKDGYDYYAVAADGSLILVHDIGDTIGWTSSEAAAHHVEWSTTVHTRDGAPNSYFDFQNEETGQYLIPAPGQILKNDDPDDPRDLGVNMRGWAAGDYSVNIERWNDATYSYVGYAYDPTTNKIVPAENGAKELEFFFAVANPKDSSSNTLHEVQTIDGKSKGITIRMYDFDGHTLNPTWPPRSSEMTSVLGASSVSSTNTIINGETIGYANQRLVSTELGDNGFPTARATGTSLSQLFNDKHKKSEASNLFVKQVYDETGYFSYDSSVNYAYLDQANGKFKLYREVAAPEMESGTTPSGQKGNFFPFDSLQQLADANSVFTNRSVQYDGDLNQLPATHPQYGEKLYKVPNDGTTDGYASYFFGMTMEANFYQGPDGKDRKGNDIIYEFNGDDDMWLYIDGLLALDIGGCHGAVSGTINFSNGIVRVNSVDRQARPSQTTLRELFESNHILPDGSPWTEEGAAKFFKGNTFADYTQHSFKMFYLERGSYASNLKVNFNLLTIEPGTFVLEKKLPENVQSAYGDAVFAYQIFTVENGVKTLYAPPEGRHTTYEESGDRVVPDGETESAGFKPSYRFDGREYRNVYFLKPGEAMVLPVTDSKVQYYVREIGIDTDVYERVNINGEQATITTTDSVVGTAELLDPTHLAATTVDSVQRRGRVTYENVPKPDHVHNLRLTKKIDSAVPVGEPAPLFRFDVQLESNATGALAPYSQGLYYIVKTDENGVDQYYKYEDGGLVPSDTPVAYTSGVNGAIGNVQEGYTILIKGLLAGTDFNVVENAKEMPAGYAYVGTEVAHAGQPQLNGSQGTIEVFTVSEGEQEVKKDALVTITNRPDSTISLYKTDESGKKHLSGAVFALEDAAGQPIKDAAGAAITYTSDTDGKLFANEHFPAGTYYLRETAAPDGYNLLSYRLVLTVPASGDVTLQAESPGTARYSDQDATDAFKFAVANNPGVELPHTGGPGTAPFVALGVLLILVAWMIRRDGHDVSSARSSAD